MARHKYVEVPGTFPGHPVGKQIKFDKVTSIQNLEIKEWKPVVNEYRISALL